MKIVAPFGENDVKKPNNLPRPSIEYAIFVECEGWKWHVEGERFRTRHAGDEPSIAVYFWKKSITVAIEANQERCGMVNEQRNPKRTQEMCWRLPQIEAPGTVKLGSSEDDG